MPATLEREIKLKFDQVDAAKNAVLRAGATPLRGRRLQEDWLLDSDNEELRRRRCALRVRVESGRSFITFKGPAQPSLMKLREELETMAADGDVLLQIFEALGFHVWFRYQKYREEFTLDDLIVAVDETPVGVFVEIEGGDRGIIDMAEALGRDSSDFLVDSYRRLYVLDCAARGVPPTDMLFDGE